MNHYVTAAIVLGIIYILFGFFVLIKRKADPIGRIFLAFTLSVAAWDISMALIEGKFFDSKLAIIILDRISYLAAPFMAMTIILYMVALKEGDWWASVKQNKIIISLGILALVNLILIPTNLISQNQGDAQMSVGPVMPLLGALILFSSLYIVYMGYVGWKTGPEGSKKLYKDVLLGFILTAAGGLVFNVVLPLFGYHSLPLLGAISTVFIVWFVSLGAAGAVIAGTLLGMLSGALAVVLISALVLVVAALIIFFIINLFRTY